MNATFKFQIDQRVMTPFGRDGIVVSAAVGRAGNSYYVETEQGGSWFYEDQLNAR